MEFQILQTKIIRPIHIFVTVDLTGAQACEVPLRLLDVILGNFLLAAQRNVDLDIWIYRLLNLCFFLVKHLVAHSGHEGLFLGEVLVIMIFCVRRDI